MLGRLLMAVFIYCYAECGNLFIVMPNGIMLIVIMANVILLSVIMLSVFMLNVDAECCYAKCHYT